MAYHLTIGEEERYVRPSGWRTERTADGFLADVKMQWFHNAQERESGSRIVDTSDMDRAIDLRDEWVIRRVPVESETPTRPEIYEALSALPEFADAQQV